MTHFFEQWVENDFNPFVLFDVNGKILFSNNEAQFLLSQTTAKEVFDLANNYAKTTFGFKTTLFDFKISQNSFYGVTVGYVDDESIGISLYKSPVKRFISISDSGEFANIYSILDLCISAASMSTKATFQRDFDPTFPDIKLQVEKFARLMGKIYESCQSSNVVTTRLSVKTGEYLKFNNKKYPIFLISIEADQRDTKKEQSIEALSQSINCIISFDSDGIKLHSPMICL